MRKKNAGGAEREDRGKVEECGGWAWPGAADPSRALECLGKVADSMGPDTN
ncbi:MAG: hypothetical protein OXI87_10280 [Albidovulum sp.]|nr:hypothetical protein [Albidovulum sp.]